MEDSIMKSYLVLIISLFGFIISCKKDFSPIEFSDNLSVIFAKSEYRADEPVQFLIENNSEEAICFIANTCQGLIGFKIEKKLNNSWSHQNNYHLNYNTDSNGVVIICDMEPLTLWPAGNYTANEFLNLQHGEYRLILQYYFGKYYKPDQEIRLFYTKSFNVL